MKNIVKTIAIALSCITLGFAQSKKQEGMFAEINTTKGTIVVALEFQKTPITVASFVSLAEGNNNQVKDSFKGKPFYNGLKFHRVIKDFMVQGGCPDGTGAGEPGYKFIDEITDLTHEGPGILSMANSGPGTNGSQFFITHKQTAWLDGKHTVFGHVITGQEIIDKIEQNDVINSVVIIRKGKEAKKFKADKIFNDYFDKKEENDKIQAVKNDEAKKALVAVLAEKQKIQAEIEAQKKKEIEAKLVGIKAAKVTSLNALRATAIKTPSGLEYVITAKGDGKKPADGANIFVHYSGYFEDGTLFDSSHEDVSRTNGKFDQSRKDGNGYAPFPFKYANKTGLIAGFLEGVNMLSFGDKITLFIPSNLAYGEAGAGGVIPGNANLIFEVEILETQPSK
ncbi:peptidylprolyl isomerase [Flavobacterium ardleyense]|uniref:peptidylprolyl isomerase n=1 Tax=Flavobacterium ardleyense TaxID=2038737 RepID=A0ABW5Z8I0_9FLAO